VSTLFAALLALGGRLAPGWAEVDGEVLTGIAHGDPPRAPDEHLDGVLAPGLFDRQVNGGAGFEVTDGPDALDAIDALQLAHGVTSYLPTLVSPVVGSALDVLATRVGDPASPVAGVHLEGPFLSPEHAGMHPVDRLRVPADGVPDWVEHPAVRMVTIAPELPGALALIERLAGRGITVSLGHSGATAQVARTAIDAGARMVTHVFNAMGPLHHRAPGLAGVALVDERVRVGVIPDARHVDPIVLELVRRCAGDRVALVTDATPAAGAGPGRFSMAGVAIDGDGRTADGRLAGSVLTLDAAVRGWVAATEATLASALFAAAESATSGAPANLVVLDDRGAVQRVMRHGVWLDRDADGCPDGASTPDSQG
jgi:N-acetylglucosamine-6-phosphate deacetylase